VPPTIYDLNWDDLAIEREAPCDHGLKLRKFVAFEGTNTGKKFIAFEGTNTGKKFIGYAKEVWIICIAKLIIE
jgi:hypothetical protein